MASLQVIQGSSKGKTFELTGRVTEIGRQNGSLPLADVMISRKHARVFYRSGRWLIEDLGSANGTFIDGMEINRSMPLISGNQIRCGTTILEFIEDNREESLADLNGEDDGLNATIIASIPSAQDSIILADKELAGSPQTETLRIIYELISESSAILSVDKLLNITLEKIFNVVEADRGFAMLIDDGDKLKIKASKIKKSVKDKRVPLSRSIIKEVIKKEMGVLITDEMNANEMSLGDSIHDLGIRSTICVPIKGREGIIGIIQVSCSISSHTHTNEELRLLTAIGFQTGLALENINMHESLVQSERMAAMGETVAFLSHHIKNILQGLSSGVELVDMKLQDDNVEKARRAWPLIQRNIRRINQLILNMLAFSKERKLKFESININDIIEECVGLEKMRAEGRGVMMMTNLDYVPPVLAESSGLLQAILNLISNAVDAVPEEKGLVSVESRLDSSTNSVLIQIGDNGGGIDPEHMKKIFTPFFSSKGNEGTGLGLAVAHKVIKEHGGKLKVSSKKDEGTKFTITLPVLISDDPDQTVYQPKAKQL